MDARVMEGVIGDAEARLNAVRRHAEAMSAKAAALDACVTHLRAMLRRFEWQLIATAPKHSRALVCGGVRNCDDGYHDAQSAWIDGCGNVWADDRKEGGAPIKPMYWMPLPDLPAFTPSGEVK